MIKKITTSINKKETYSKNLNEKIKGLKIGMPSTELIICRLKLVISLEKGIDILKKSGAKMSDISLPHTKYALPTYYIVAPAEASSNLIMMV